MIITNKRKIEGGKFARVKIVVEKGLVVSVKVTGDFFLYPEDTLEKIECSLRSMNLPFDAGEAERRIQKVLVEENAGLVGIAPRDLVEMIGECLDEVQTDKS